MTVILSDNTLSARLRQRSVLIQAVRTFFQREDYLEVETPIRIPTPIPEAHICGFTSEGWYLQSSPEICMKQLVAAGCPRIFQICKCFRKEEKGPLHLTEMTLLEWYTQGDTYLDTMDQTEALIRAAADATGCKDALTYQGQRIRLDRPWQRMTVEEAFHRFGRCSMADALSSNCFDEVIAFDIEPNLGRERPVFLMDYPARMASLSRMKPDEPRLAERFELYIAGIELANGFSELNNPDEQRRRFEKEIHTGNLRETAMPETFLESLSHLPDCAGIALGLDRLIMVLTNARTIDQVVAFTSETL